MSQSKDAHLLATAARRLQRYEPRVRNDIDPTDGIRRASVAIVLRMRPRNWSDTHGAGGDSGAVDRSPEHDTQDSSVVDAFLRQGWVQTARLEVLYMLRQTRPGDPWSGHVAFPGGKQEKDKDGSSVVLTAIRETMEEIGLDLACKRKYALLGRLDDLSVGYNARLVVSPIVFLQLTPHDEPFTLQESEVQSCRWVSVRWVTEQLAVLTTSSDSGKAVSIRLNRLARPLSRVISDSVNDALGLTVQFPGVYLQEYDSRHQPDKRYHLWGMTLKFTAKLLEVAHLWSALGHTAPEFRRLARRLNGYMGQCPTSQYVFRLPRADWYSDNDPLGRIIAVAVFALLSILVPLTWMATTLLSGGDSSATEFSIGGGNDAAAG